MNQGINVNLLNDPVVTIVILKLSTPSSIQNLSVFPFLISEVTTGFKLDIYQYFISVSSVTNVSIVSSNLIPAVVSVPPTMMSFAENPPVSRNYDKFTKFSS